MMPTNEALGRQNASSQAELGRVVELQQTRVLQVLLFDSSGWLEAGLRRAAEVLGQSDRLRVLREEEVGQTTSIDLMVWEQVTPAENSLETYEHWHRRFPLARSITVWGPWCIGGFRNGFPVSGENYVAWLVWPWQVQCFLRQWFSDQGTLWDLPRTASLAERLGRAAVAYERDPAWGPVSIDLIGSESGLAEAVAAACETLGWSVTRFDGVPQRQAALLQRGPDAVAAHRFWIWARPAALGDDNPVERLGAGPSGSGLELQGFSELTYAAANDSGTLGMEPPCGSAGPRPAAVSTQAISYGAEPRVKQTTGVARRVILPQPFLLAELQAAVRDLCF